MSKGKGPGLGGAILKIIERTGGYFVPGGQQGEHVDVALDVRLQLEGIDPFAVTTSKDVTIAILASVFCAPKPMKRCL